jgi:deazaflavin-dependent oxidoreductase (nitroreductase family)
MADLTADNTPDNTPDDTAADGTAPGDSTGTNRHYREPGWFTRNVFNRTIAWLTRRGVSVWGSRVLEVRGRTSGQPRRVPVNLLELDGRHYLVSPRGEGQWVRNVRAAGGRLATIVGHRREEWVAEELHGADAVPVLRAYLKRWKFEVGVFFEGVSDASDDAEIEAAVPRHPVFVLTAAGSGGQDDTGSGADDTGSGADGTGAGEPPA